MRMDLGRRAEELRFLIRDRDIWFTMAFDEVFTSIEIRVITTPVWVPTGQCDCRTGSRVAADSRARAAFARPPDATNPNQPRSHRWPAGQSLSLPKMARALSVACNDGSVQGSSIGPLRRCRTIRTHGNGS